MGWNVDNKCCEKHISAILTPCFAASVFPVSCFNNVGFPNNDQWMYYDDIEYYIRCIRAGYNTVFDKNICAYHPLPMKKSSKRIIKAQEEGKEKMIEISRDIKKNDKALYEKIKYKWDIEKKLRKDLTLLQPDNCFFTVLAFIRSAKTAPILRCAQAAITG